MPPMWRIISTTFWLWSTAEDHGRCVSRKDQAVDTEPSVMEFKTSSISCKPLTTLLFVDLREKEKELDWFTAEIEPLYSLSSLIDRLGKN